MTDSNKKWIRFNLRTLFVVVAIWACLLSAWRWYSWPERTLRHLDRQAGKSDASIDISFSPNYRITPDAVAHQLKQSHTCRKSRTIMDIVCGRLVFEPALGDVMCWADIGSGEHAHVFLESVTVERGVIKYKWRTRSQELPGQMNSEENGEDGMGGYPA